MVQSIHRSFLNAIAAALALIVILFILLDTGIGLYLTYKYREVEPYAALDDLMFLHWKTLIHKDLLISNGLLLSLFIVL